MYKKIVTMAKGCLLNVKAIKLYIFFLVVDFIMNFKVSLYPF